MPRDTATAIIHLHASSSVSVACLQVKHLASIQTNSWLLTSWDYSKVITSAAVGVGYVFSPVCLSVCYHGNSWLDFHETWGIGGWPKNDRLNFSKFGGSKLVQIVQQSIHVKTESGVEKIICGTVQKCHANTSVQWITKTQQKTTAYRFSVYATMRQRYALYIRRRCLVSNEKIPDWINLPTLPVH